MPKGIKIFDGRVRPIPRRFGALRHVFVKDLSLWSCEHNINVRAFEKEENG